MHWVAAYHGGFYQRCGYHLKTANRLRHHPAPAPLRSTPQTTPPPLLLIDSDNNPGLLPLEPGGTVAVALSPKKALLQIGTHRGQIAIFRFCVSRSQLQPGPSHLPENSQLLLRMFLITDFKGFRTCCRKTGWKSGRQNNPIISTYWSSVQCSQKIFPSSIHLLFLFLVLPFKLHPTRLAFDK